MTDEAISPLRRRMIEDMTIRKLAPNIPSPRQRGRATTGHCEAERFSGPQRDMPLRGARPISYEFSSHLR
jgi:hypothetical protein